ncbi:MAG: hypothetical protein PHR28_11980 [candidate division Zixibacteria bacterium]|nr:hypothetical protein [candidate division Zixibacteria bacterium]
MLEKRLTALILLGINLGLVLFLLLRVGSAKAPHGSGSTPPLRMTHLSAIEPKPDTLILNDFEIPPDLVNMYRQGGDFAMNIVSDHATHGGHSLQFDKKDEDNIEVATTVFPRNWHGYDRLEFDVFDADPDPGTIWLRVGSQFDSRRFYVKSQKYARGFPLKPGPNTISIPLDDIRRAFGQIPYYKSLHFNIPANGGQRLHLDYVRLVRHDG